MSEPGLNIQIAVNATAPVLQIGVNAGEPDIAFEMTGTARYHPPYEGVFVVVPSVEEAQMLETGGKYLTEDVTVEAVPVAVVSNQYGGRTYTIGGGN